MITLFDLYERFIGEVNTHQGGHVKPNRNFVQWVDSISIDIFNDLVKEYENTNVISDMLTPFLKTKNIIVTGQPNQMWDVVKLPGDYNYFASARIIRRGGESCGCSLYETVDGATGKKTDACDSYIDEDELAKLQQQADDNLCEIPIDKVRTAQWSSVCGHATMPPTINRPKLTAFEGGLKLAPKRLGVIILDYFRKPVSATFLYTIINPNTENEYIQYNTASQPLEWDSKMIPEFIARLKVKYGTFVREASIYNAGTTEQKT